MIQRLLTWVSDKLSRAWEVDCCPHPLDGDEVFDEMYAERMRDRGLDDDVS